MSRFRRDPAPGHGRLPELISADRDIVPSNEIDRINKIHKKVVEAFEIINVVGSSS